MTGELVQVQVDDAPGRAMAEAFKRAPLQLLHQLALAYQQIGQGDIEALRSEQLSGGRFLNVRNAGTRKAFKFKATDPARQITDPRQLFVNEYTRWEGARFHADGGTITSRGAMWVLTASGKGPNGRRRFTAQQIEQYLRTGRFVIAPLPGLGSALIDTGEENVGGVRVKVHGRRHSNVIAFLRRSVRMKQRLDWLGLIQRRQALHVEQITAAIHTALAESHGAQQ